MWSSTQQNGQISLAPGQSECFDLHCRNGKVTLRRARREVDSRQEVESPGDTENDGLVWLKEDM